jgi:hypothetical protein
MYMYLYIYTYTHVYVCIHVFIYSYKNVYIHMYIYMTSTDNIVGKSLKSYTEVVETEDAVFLDRFYKDPEELLMKMMMFTDINYKRGC